MTTTRTGYSALQIGLHWLTALVIIAAWWFSEGMGQALRDRVASGATGITGNTLHVWLGGAAFMLILLRVVVRLVQGAPGPVSSRPLAALAATWGHRLLYVLMLAVPALGAAAWYLGIAGAAGLHETLANLLVLVALGHAVIAIGHQVLLRDGTLDRMRRPAR